MRSQDQNIRNDSDWKKIPSELKRSLESSLGAGIEEWFDANLKLAEVYSEKWGLDLKKILTGGALSLCIYGLKDQREIVLKIPIKKEFGIREFKALRIWGGLSTPEVIESDDETGAFVMKYIRSELHELEAKEIVKLCSELNLHFDEVKNVAGIEAFKDISENLNMRISWAKERFRVEEYRHERKQLEWAESLQNDLLKHRDPRSERILHGDLQDKNILYSGEKTVALDPLPVVGNELFDLAFWVSMTKSGRSIMSLAEEVAAAAEIDKNLFLKWVLLISIIENRPYIEKDGQRKKAFIDQVLEQLSIRL